MIALTGCAVESAGVVLDGLRSRLAAAITVAGLPAFTVSIGVIQADPQEELPTLISRADQALFQAKRDGRDQVVVHDALGSVVQPPDLHLAAPGTDHHGPDGSDSDRAVQPSIVLHLDRSAGQSVSR